MLDYAWDLSGTDDRCSSYAHGHLVHWIQFKHSVQNPDAVIPVTVTVDDDALIHIDGDDVAVLGWNHRPALVAAALHRFGGTAVWKPRWYLLAVPTDSAIGSERSVFSIARLDQRSQCRASHLTNLADVEPRVTALTTVPPLPIAARYAAGRPEVRRRR